MIWHCSGFPYLQTPLGRNFGDGLLMSANVILPLVPIGIRTTAHRLISRLRSSKFTSQASESRAFLRDVAMARKPKPHLTAGTTPAASAQLTTFYLGCTPQKACLCMCPVPCRLYSWLLLLNLPILSYPALPTYQAFASQSSREVRVSSVDTD
jgi:hypothetical protein